MQKDFKELQNHQETQSNFKEMQNEGKKIYNDHTET